MKIKFFLLQFLLFSAAVLPQDKENYLSQHKSNLNSSYTFPESDAKIIGFGAYHGAAKTEDAELLILQSVISKNSPDYYFAETDISIAHYFNEYLKSGDEELLKDLIVHYGVRVPQERTVNVFEKWKQLKIINDKQPKNKRITVLGADVIVTYKYTYLHLLSLIKNTSHWPMALQLKATVAQDTTDFSPYYDSFSKQQLKQFVSDYEAGPALYAKLITDKPLFDYIIGGIKTSFADKYSREKTMYTNYLKLYGIYNLKDKKQFFRLGFFHLLKHKEGEGASFFSMLIDNGIYNKNEVKSILGYLTKSEVIWDDIYDEKGEYVRSTTLGDEGTGDAPNEYFKGIEAFKKQPREDMCIFELNAAKSPYSTPQLTDLIEIISTNAAKINYGTAATTDFIDYALLISNSPASVSIYTIVKP